VNIFTELLETSVGDKAQLNLNLQRKLPLARVDSNHLEMALLNIVVNARDASPTGGSITVTTRAIQINGDAMARHLQPGEHVMIAVTDEGTGMPPHIKARAIEPFFTTKGPQHGTGLGLAMVHGFVEQSGGRLEIDSEPGLGTTIRMLFPKFTPEEDPVSSAPSGYQATTVDPDKRRPLILVVDDGREIADIAAELLTDTGYRTKVAVSGEEALRIFNEAAAQGDAVDLLFSDVIMPGGMNGMVLADQIRQCSPKIPIILTTGYNDEMSQDGPRFAAMEVLGKPYKPSELVDRVQAALRQGGRTGPGRQTSDFGHLEA
jgi:CheY-like chemotaxis protein